MLARILRVTFPLRSLLGLLLVLTAIVGMIVTAREGTRRACELTDCRCNLKFLSCYLDLYAARFGNEREFPPASVSAARTFSTPPNVLFWEALWSLPSPPAAVSHRPGDDSIYVCPGAHIPLTATALTYTSPR